MRQGGGPWATSPIKTGAARASVKDVQELDYYIIVEGENIIEAFVAPPD